MIDFPVTTKLQPSPQILGADLEAELEKLSKEFRGVIATKAPDEMRSLMTTDSPSAFGEPPAIVTRELYDTIEGDAENQTITLAGHAFFLDPMFQGEPNGGGYLNRPLIERAIEQMVAKNLSEL